MSSKDYEGFRYSTKILDADEQLLEELIINAKDHIVYDDYFYHTIKGEVDYAFIDQLFREK